MKNFWKFLSFVLFGWIAGMIFKDNVGKPDEQINVDLSLDVKRNKLFNTKEKRKVFNFLRKKENKV